MYLFLLDSLCLVFIEGLLPFVEVFEGAVARVVHDELHGVLPGGVGRHLFLLEQGLEGVHGLLLVSELEVGRRLLLYWLLLF